MVARRLLYASLIEYIFKEAFARCTRAWGIFAHTFHYSGIDYPLIRRYTGKNSWRITFKGLLVALFWVIVTEFFVCTPTVVELGCAGVPHCTLLEMNVWAVSIFWFLCMLAIGFILQTFIFYITYYNGLNDINVLYYLAIVIMICHYISVFSILESLQMGTMQDSKNQCNGHLTEMHYVFCSQYEDYDGYLYGAERLEKVDIYLHGQPMIFVLRSEMEE